MSDRPVLDHIGIAVESVAAGCAFYEALGLEVSGEEEVASGAEVGGLLQKVLDGFEQRVSQATKPTDKCQRRAQYLHSSERHLAETRTQYDLGQRNRHGL